MHSWIKRDVDCLKRHYGSYTFSWTIRGKVLLLLCTRSRSQVVRKDSRSPDRPNQIPALSAGSNSLVIAVSLTKLGRAPIEEIESEIASSKVRVCITNKYPTSKHNGFSPLISF